MTPLQLAIKIVGSQTALARRIGKTQGHISKWLERDYVPPESVLALESATGISRHEWRPDLYPEDPQGFAEDAQELVTHEAKDLPKRKWTVAEMDALVRAGVLLEDDRFELIDGVIRPMNPKGLKHEVIKGSLAFFWYQNMPPRLMMIPETTFRMSVDTFVEPDFTFFLRSTGVAGLKPETALLAVEVSDTTFRYDTGRKAKLYARFGIPELWVINANKLEAHVFTKPSTKGYLEKRLVKATEILAADFAPELAVKLAELEML